MLLFPELFPGDTSGTGPERPLREHAHLGVARHMSSGIGPPALPQPWGPCAFSRTGQGLGSNTQMDSGPRAQRPTGNCRDTQPELVVERVSAGRTQGSALSGPAPRPSACHGEWTWSHMP